MQSTLPWYRLLGVLQEGLHRAYHCTGTRLVPAAKGIVDEEQIDTHRSERDRQWPMREVLDHCRFTRAKHVNSMERANEQTLTASDPSGNPIGAGLGLTKLLLVVASPGIRYVTWRPEEEGVAMVVVAKTERR